MRQNMLALCIPFSPLSVRFVNHVSLYHTWGSFVNPLNLKILDFLRVKSEHPRVRTASLVLGQWKRHLSPEHCTSVADKRHTRRPDAYVNADSNPNLEGIGPWGKEIGQFLA